MRCLKEMSEDKQTVLVVAFDGLDHNLIEEYECEHLMQEEFGTMDVTTDISQRVTSELYTNFITGKSYKTHGVKGMDKQNLRSKIVEKLFPHPLRALIPNGINIGSWLEDVVGAKKEKWQKKHYDTPTLFEKVDSSKAMFVPGYNPDPYWRDGVVGCMLNKGAEFDEVNRVNYYNFQKRKDDFEDYMQFRAGEHDLVMIQFHYCDFFQHFYGNSMKFEEGRMKDMYNQMDQLAKKIKDMNQMPGNIDGQYFDKIIFFSDHGLPDYQSHNPNSFYSINKDIGIKEKIEESGAKLSIRDFHDLILGWATGWDAEPEEYAVTDGVVGKEDDASSGSSKEQEIKDKLNELGYT